MRDRLIKLLQDNSYLDVLDDEHWLLAAEQLLAEGVIVPPYKVNTKVYVIASQTGDNQNLYIFEDTITHYRICDGCTIMCVENHLGVPSWNWNKVFRTREEAERALERSENEKQKMS